MNIKVGNMKEQSVAQRVLLQAANMNVILWRNNSGACQDQTGRLIRYGLGNESAKQNREIKSSDYVGVTPVVAYLDGIGWTTLGVFTAIETKGSDWKFDQSDERAVAQAAFHSIVRSYGGYAGFATGPDDVARIVGRAK